MQNHQKILAYYFPQYHSINENDIVHGNGFTDWNLFKNEKRDLSFCKYPLEPPIGLSFYDPTEIDVRKKQAILAKKYGIDGFIYYHYWLENRIVMEKVLKKMLNDDEPDLPFCLCFANESWKHCYNPIDGKYKSFYPNRITYRQLYNDPIEHAYFLQKFFSHKNYIKIDNKPILFIYRSYSEVYSYLNIICKEMKKYGIDDLYLIANTSDYCLMNYSKINERIPDAYSPFPAHPAIKLPDELCNLPCVYSGIIGWDSRPRHQNNKRIINHDPKTTTIKTYQNLLTMYYDKKSPQIYSIFAWNEWAEGAVIEPNTFYGEDLGYAIKKAREIIEIVINKNIEFFYGNNNIFKNITLQALKLIHNFHDNWYIYIPKCDNVRDNLFGDPIMGVHKVIKVIYNNKEEIYDEFNEIKILIV